MKTHLKNLREIQKQDRLERFFQGLRDGLTMREIAYRRIGISQSALSQWLKRNWDGKMK